MTRAPAGPAFLNLFDPTFSLHSPESIAAREQHWYAETPLGYAVLRHRECNELLRDRRLRQQGLDVLSMQGVTEGPLVTFWAKAMLGMDDEPHLRVRKLVQAAFTPRRVEALRPQVRAVVAELLADLRDRDRVDFMTVFADRFPVRIIAAMLGVPPSGADRLATWTETLGLMFAFPVTPHMPAIDAAVSEMGEYVDGLIAVRRAQPDADMISALLAVEVSGDRLSDVEVRNLVMMVALGGHDTTRCQLGSAIAIFLDHPDQWELLGTKPELGPSAAEEVMRLLPTVPMIFRVTRDEFSYQDMNAPAGTFIGMCAALAQTDPREYGEAPFDITAHRTPPLTFGGGPHFCVGAALSRLEQAEALAILARELPTLRAAGEIEWLPPIGITGPAHLPISTR